MDEQMRELSCRRIEVDEIWAFVGKKQRHMTALDDPRRLGDQYTFVALDPETKLVPAYRIGKRDLPTATAFLTDLSDRLTNRVQLSSDALAALCRGNRASVWRRCRLRPNSQILRS
jgi:hypothetical protein